MIELGRLGLGTAPLAGLYEAVAEQVAVAAIERAWELGVRYFDTAPRYGAGLAERRLGAALRGKPRESFAVSTKVGRLLRPGASAWHGAPALVDYFDFSRDATLRSLEGSLDRLGLDRIDVALVHDPDDHFEEALAGAFAALQQLRDERLVTAIGVGANDARVLCRFAREADPDCVLVAGRWTLLDRRAGAELLPLCEEHGIAVVVGGVFNSGLLAGGDTFEYERAPTELRDRARTLGETCTAFGVPLPAAAMQFPLRHPAVSSVLVGCRDAAEVEEDVRLFALDVPDELWWQLA
jgi:D-threo-aldose 1-dehydrogenase